MGSVGLLHRRRRDVNQILGASGLYQFGFTYAYVAFGVIWLYWAFSWGLFFLLLGLGWDRIGRYTGAVCATQGIVTGAIPAFLLLTGE